MLGIWEPAGASGWQSAQCIKSSQRFRPALSAFLLGTTALFSVAVIYSHPASAAGLLVGATGSGETKNISGTETYDPVYIGNNSGEIGTVNVLGGAKLIIGPGDLIFGNLSGSSGTVNVSGSGSALEASSRVFIGKNGTGDVTVSNGATLITNGVSAGGLEERDEHDNEVDYDGNGSLTVTGSGTTWTNNSGLEIGRATHSSGKLTISDGATATLAGGLYGETGATVLITGDNTSLTIGNKSDVESTVWFSFVGGDITLADGAYLYSDGGYIGGSTSAATSMTVSGSGTTWDTTQRIFVGGDDGGGGDGKLVISDGASVGSTTIGAGLDTGSTGEIIMTGAGTKVHAFAVPELDSPGNFYASYAGDSTVTLSDGASLTIDNELRIASAAGSNGTFNIGAAEGSGATAAGALNVPTIAFGNGTGTLVFNHTDSNYILSSAVTGAGTLKSLAGTTHLTGDYSGYTGNVAVNGGLLSVDTSSFVGSAFTVNSGTLAVNGAISGVPDAVTMNGATLTNSGTISGSQYGVKLAAGGNTLTNSGTISGGTASVFFATGGNRLNVQPSASFGTVVDFNTTTGNTTAFGAGSYSVPVARYLTAGNSVELNNDRQTVLYNAPASSSGKINVIDMGAMASSSATTLAITSSVSTVMTDILDTGIERNGPVYDPMGSGVALGYAASTPKTEAETAAATMAADGLAVDPYGNLIWMRAFGGQRFDAGVGATSGNAGLALGLDHVFDQTRIGAMGGYGKTVNQMDDNSSKVSGDTVFGGAYARQSLDGYDIDFSLIAGGIFATAERQINAGAETATGNYNGWFMSPEMAISGDYDLGSGWTLTPKGVARYTHGSFGGYSEQGSSQNITYGNRSTDALQAALELKISRQQQLANGQMASIAVTGTILDTYNVGSSDLNGSLQGTDFTLSSSADRNVIGGKLGISAELKLDPQSTLFAGAKAGISSDNSWDYSANAGFKIRF